MNRVINLLITVLFCHSLYGQKAAGPSPVEYPREMMKVHLSQTCLFPGEVLAFKIYCTNPFFPELELSRMAFIELVSDLNVPVLRKKILLEQGRGKGEFVLPEDLGSGIYFVLTYTNWLKNFGEESFDRKRIVIIHPDRGVAPGSDTCNSIQNDLSGPGTTDHSPSGILLSTDKGRYATREEVSLQVKLNPEEGTQGGGSFSVSVCYTEPGLCRGQPEESPSGKKMKAEEILYLPDYSGIRLTGKLEDVSGMARTHERVILSEPGPGTKVNSTLSDGEGTFHFLITPQEGEKELVFTLPAADAILKLEEPYWNGFRSPPGPQALCLDENTLSFLREKYFHFQLQQKFNRPGFLRSGELEPGPPDSSSFYTSTSRLLRMDDYILLDSLAEYFYELVPSVKFIQGRGKVDIRVTDPVSGFPYEEKPGVFLDGVLYSDYGEIAHIPVREIEKIVIIPEVYYYGDFSFGGIVDLHTFASDFNAVQLLPGMVRVIWPMASKPGWKFNNPDSSLSTTPNRIPDFRHLILWEPDFKIGPSGENSIQFYTGDLTGDFTIRVTGISPEGRLFQSETRITVDR